ncbi:tetratricopeptide repeat protein [Pseudochrobactrum sp. MP213Fo]|uniref:tetratricopeptide repeat protein n=1 Tax=Pseudochrobactrum sp. MP213Fo TaxID=3022250 RepID=UPI003BA11F3E
MSLNGRFLHYDSQMMKSRRAYIISLSGALLLCSMHAYAQVQPMPPAITIPQTNKPAEQPAPQTGTVPAAKPKPQNPTVETSGPLSEMRAKQQEELFTSLRKASSPEKSHAIASRLRQSFVRTGSDSLDLMLRWAETALNQSREAEAQDFIDEVIAQRPDLASVWLLRGRLHLRQNKLSAALSDIKQAMILEPRNFDVLINYATLLRETGNSKAALRLYQQALSIYPMMKEAQDEMLRITEETSDIAL